MTSRMTSRMTTRNAIPKVSLYESDQDDNLNDDDYYPEIHFMNNETYEDEYVLNTRTRNRVTMAKPMVVAPVSKDKMKKRKQYLEKVETKKQNLVDRKKRDKRLTAVKAEASQSKYLHLASSLTDMERTQTKRELKKYLLEATLLREKIAELHEMFYLDETGEYM